MNVHEVITKITLNFKVVLKQKFKCENVSN